MELRTFGDEAVNERAGSPRPGRCAGVACREPQSSGSKVIPCGCRFGPASAAGVIRPVAISSDPSQLGVVQVGGAELAPQGVTATKASPSEKSPRTASTVSWAGSVASREDRLRDGHGAANPVARSRAAIPGLRALTGAAARVPN